LKPHSPGTTKGEDRVSVLSIESYGNRPGRGFSASD
jgi:hypothetical protein